MASRKLVVSLILLIALFGLTGVSIDFADWLGYGQDQVNKPELHPISVTFSPPSPIDPTKVKRVVVFSEIENTGNLAAGAFTVEFAYRCEKQCLDESTDYVTFDAMEVFSGLGVGGRVTVTGILDTANPPRAAGSRLTGPLEPGVYRIRILVIPPETGEQDEDNNEITALLSIGTVAPPMNITALAIDSKDRRIGRATYGKAIYVGDKNGLIKAFKLGTCPNCQELWPAPFNEPRDAINVLVINEDNGTIYAGSKDKNVYAISSEGVRLCKSSIARAAITALILDDTGIPYAGTADGTVFAIDPTRCTTKWQVSIARAAITTLIADKRGAIYAGSQDGTLYALDSARGSLKWQFNARGAITALAIDNYPGDERVYASSEDSKVYALALNGTEKTGWPFTSPTRGEYFTSLDITTDGSTIYTGSNQGNIYAINYSGTVESRAWPVAIARNAITRLKVDRPISYPVEAKGKILAVSADDGKFYVINPDGTEDAKFRGGVSTGGPMIAIPQIDEGDIEFRVPVIRTVYFGAQTLKTIDIEYR